MEWEIRRYDRTLQEEWDDFVAASRGGTFLFMRGYMDYHADRFDDASLMVYRGGKLLALLPAHVVGEAFCSHRGLTYGGMVTDRRMTAAWMSEVFAEVAKFVRLAYGVSKWEYSPIPYIYYDYPGEEDLYALFRMGARLTARKISTVVPGGGRGLGFSSLRRRKLNHALYVGLTVATDDDFATFWPVLEDNLRMRHGARPVHTLDEIMLLHSRFPNHIFLHRVCGAGGQTLAGCVVYLTRTVAHVQYIGSTAEGRSCGAVDLLFHRLIHEVYADVPYFDLGTSVEQGGRVLNEGLVFQKEGFGGRAVVYDTYEMDVEGCV